MRREEEAAARVHGVRRTLQAGLVLYAVGLGALWLGPDLPVLDLLFLPGLLFLLPALAVAQLPLVEQEDELERIPAYLASAFGILVLGLLSLVLGIRLGGVEEMGLAPPDPLPLIVWSGGLTGVGLGLMALFHRFESAYGRSGSPLLRHLIPRTGRERFAFLGLSLAAGTGEEVAYRAYALVALGAAGFSPWTAALVASVAFGFLHAYQGRIGIVRTGLLGFLLAGSFLVSGSLWPAMVAHFLIDVVGGLYLGPRWFLEPVAAEENGS